MNKIRTTITIDKELLQRAKNNHVAISSFLDVELRKYLAIIENKNITINSYKNKENNENNVGTAQSKNSKSINTFSIYDKHLGARGVAWHPSTLGW